MNDKELLQVKYCFIYEKISQYERYIRNSKYEDTTELKAIVDKMRKETTFSSFTDGEFIIIRDTCNIPFSFNMDRRAKEEFERLKQEYNLNI